LTQLQHSEQERPNSAYQGIAREYLKITQLFDGTNRLVPTQMAFFGRNSFLVAWQTDSMLWRTRESGDEFMACLSL
jgi:hypothetical protein